VSKETADSEEEEVNQDTTVHPNDGLSATEGQDEEVKVAEGSESEMSVVLDEAPKKQRKKSASTGTMTKAAPKAKATKASAKPTKEETPDEAEIKRLQGWLVKCGIRKLWHRELAPYDAPKAKIKHLKEMLKDAGMDGRYSEPKAKAIKERRELEADLEAVQEGAKQWGNESGEEDGESDDAEPAPRPQRRAAANRFVDFGEDDDDDDE
jgi:hypothetical protein